MYTGKSIKMKMRIINLNGGLSTVVLNYTKNIYRQSKIDNLAHQIKLKIAKLKS